MDREQITCVIGDDHEALRSGLAALLDAEDDLRVVGQARDGRELLELAERRRPDVMVADIGMPTVDGIAFCREITARPDPPAVVLYTGTAETDVLQSALDAGARGFVVKSGPPQDLVRAIRTVHAGLPYVDGMLGAALFNRRAESLLSGRETEVLQHLANGLTTEGVGKELYLSPATVRSYTEHAMHKLGASNRVHAVTTALRMGLIN
ncbi:MAG TPA: response regulator transcription factor [Solirubrobacteraceae bacterium]|jgi:DNA-binding NarL/FixJ family response regulator|nr:response regulator transcription factor [Solirubrobacteraceae bacterium]